MLSIIIMCLAAACLGTLLRKGAERIDAKRGGMEARNALSSAGLSLLIKEKEKKEVKS